MTSDDHGPDVLVPESDTAARSAWNRSLVKAGIAYVASRVMVMAGAAVVASQRVVDANVDGLPRPEAATGLIVDVLSSWDGAFYLELVRRGYPSAIPADVTYVEPDARAAFFPLYPMIVDAADRLLPGGSVIAGLAVNFVLGTVAVYLVGLIARSIFDAKAAERSMILMALFPGAFILSFAYSEALLIVLAAGCLYALQRRQWLAAGVLAALATATRPNGVAVAAACAVAAIIAIRDDRDWRALLAPALAPIGFIAFQWYLRVHTGEPWAWFRVQRDAWGEGTSFGITALDNTFGFLAHPLRSPTDTLTGITIVITAALLWTAWKKRLPWPMVTYVAVVLALMLIPETVTARPRFLYTAFPLLITAGAWWPNDNDTTWARDAWTMLIALGGAGLVTLTALYGVNGAVP